MIECCWPFCGGDPKECDCADNLKKEVMQPERPIDQHAVAPPPVSEAGGDHLCTLGRFSSWRDCPEHSGNMHTKHAEMNTSGETCIDSVPLPTPCIHGGTYESAPFEYFTADQLRAYGDERTRALRAELVESMNAEMQVRRERDHAVACVAELESLLRMIATRAQTFPDFPIGWHIPEVFKAVGMQMPERPDTDDTHDGLRARIAELGAKLKDSEDIQFAMLGLIADIRKAAGDPEGKLMQAELVELIGRQREGCDKAREAEDCSRESMAMYRRERERADRITVAAHAVVVRWGSPLWKDQTATAGYIYRLRDAIAAGGGDEN